MADITQWSDLLLEASRRDFTAAFASGRPGNGQPEQGGPTRTSRAMAIVHLAIHDARLCGVDPAATYLSRNHGFTPVPPANFSVEAAIDGAAFRSMCRLYPASRALFQTGVTSSDRASFAFGESLAEQLLTARAGDGAAANAPFGYGAGYGQHQPDPMAPSQEALTPHWGQVAHFVGGRVDLDPYPGRGQASLLDDPLYRQDYDEVVSLGGRDRGARTPEQEATGVYWAYDGVDGIGVPPRLYNQIARAVAAQRGMTDDQIIALLALVNVAMADAGIDAWHWKYVFDLWRPAVGVRAETTSVGGDPFWEAFGVPKTLTSTAGATTPGFPAYPSGHATFGAALFQILRRFEGGSPITLQEVLDAETDASAGGTEAFTFVSDELDGATRDLDGSVRARVERTYPSYAKAVFDNSISRVYLGVHWRFDGLPRDAGKNVGGVPLGLEIANQVFDFFAPHLVTTVTAPVACETMPS